MSTQTNAADADTEESDARITLDDAGDVSMPVVEILTGRGFITGKSGSGKSNSASVIAEELLDDQYPLLIVDTDGEYYGLKEEYKVLHVGADEECDLQVGPEHGEKLAELALHDNVPIILDVSGFLDEDEGNELIRETAHALFTKEKKQKQPFLMLVEEVHEFIPEKGSVGETGQMLIKIGKRGRKHGLGIVGISQRPADVKKDFITQCDWLLWHRLTWNNDTKVVGRVADSETADAVEDLDDGEAFLMADWQAAHTRRVQFRRKHTFDAGQTPGLEDFERPELKSVSGDLVDELEEITEQQSRRQDRIAQLEAKIETLEAEKAELQDELENARDMQDMAKQFSNAMVEQAESGDADGPSEQVEDLIEERNTLQKRLKEREERVDELEAELADVREELQQRPDIGERAVEAAEVLADELGVGGEDAEKLRSKLKSAREKIDELEAQVNAAPTDADLDSDPLDNRKVQAVVQDIESTLQNLGEKERQMLRYYVVNGPASMKDAYNYAGGSPTSGAKSTKTKELREAGLVNKSGRAQYTFGLRDYLDDALDGFSDDEVARVYDHLEAEVYDLVMEAGA